ncbi:type II methionyl aminopeptidase [Candidatus Woesearchaeota archaeon]|nr:type II methionyl aminopeptidase [Candidatus Woesearchaeota archaeon]
METKEDWIKAGEIASKAREYGKSICKEGITYLELATKIETKIVELGGKVGFPVDISVNEIAAHASPFPDDVSVIKKGDVVKLDIGAHYNGYVADTACTIEVGTNNYKKLIEASEEALNNAINIVKIGTKLGDIGKVIQDTIIKFGFSPVKNLSGHGVAQWEIHTWPTVPNYDNNDKTELKRGMCIAIEPFATTGRGMIKDGKKCGVYSLVNLRPVRDSNARKLVEYIQNEYKTLPFHVRHLTKFPNANYLLRLLEREGVLMQYTQLPDVDNGIVSQTEHTIYIDDECVVITR